MGLFAAAQLASGQASGEQTSRLAWSRWLGGSLLDGANQVAVDGKGNIYVAGSSISPDFPMTSPGPRPGSGHLYVAKLDPAGGLVYSTLIGGSGSNWATGLAVDGDGQVFLYGMTTSKNLPVVNAIQRENRGGVAGFDTFLARLDTSGRVTLLTYLGGTLDDNAGTLALDGKGGLYLSGGTDSRDFPVTSGQYPGKGEFSLSAFVVKLEQAGEKIAWARYHGGSRFDGARAISLDRDGDVHIGGEASSTDFPVTPGAIQKDQRGGELRRSDAFYAKFSGRDGSLLYSTLLGGRGDELGLALATGPDGSAYLGGMTASTDFPVTAGAYQPRHGGEEGGFVARIIAATGQLVYSTYLVGSDLERVQSLAVNEAAEAFAAGITWSRTFPVKLEAQAQRRGWSDFFVVRLDAHGRNALQSTLLGGSLDEKPVSIALEGTDTVILAGDTGSSDFPLAAAGPQKQFAGGVSDVVVARLRFAESTLATRIEQVGNAASGAAGNVSPGLLVKVRGAGLGPPLPTAAAPGENGAFGGLLEGTRVLFDDMPAPILWASERELLAVAPRGVGAKETAAVHVERNGVKSNVLRVSVQAAAPGVFTLDGSGLGQAAALNEDCAANGVSTPASPGSLFTLFVTGAGKMEPELSDGAVARDASSRLSSPVRVRVGGADAEVVYAGAAPGQVAGVTQINARVPPDAAPGALALLVEVDGKSSQAGVTLAVR